MRVDRNCLSDGHLPRNGERTSEIVKHFGVAQHDNKKGFNKCLLLSLLRNGKPTIEFWKLCIIKLPLVLLECETHYFTVKKEHELEQSEKEYPGKNLHLAGLNEGDNLIMFVAYDHLHFTVNM